MGRWPKLTSLWVAVSKQDRPAAAAAHLAEAAPGPRTALARHHPALPADPAVPTRRPAARRLAPYFYVLPAFVALALFVYWPLGRTLALSLHDWNLVSPSWRYVGMANYSSLARSSDFHAALRNTVLYTAEILPLAVVLPLLLATLLAGVAGRLRSLNRTLIFTPTVVSFAVAAVVWLWMLNPIHGVIAAALRALGWQGPAWLSDPAWVIPAIVLITCWKVAGYNLVLFFAGLTSIPTDVSEAARVDGAEGWALFRHITWPLLTPTTFFVLVITVIVASQDTFVPIQMLTQGGPDQASTNLVYLIYQYAFQFFDAGHGAALAIMVFIAFLGVTALQQGLLERHVHYER